jgi:transposase InsO family protein
MTIHKKTKITPLKRREIAAMYFQRHSRISDLAKQYQVSRMTIYRILRRARLNDFSVHNSTNHRFRCLQYGLKRLSKVERQLEKKLAARAKLYQKNYPGEMIHIDTKKLPYMSSDPGSTKRQYLYVAIDDYSRELYAAILPDKTQFSTEIFLKQLLEECPYTIERLYSDNGGEFRGDCHHAVTKFCLDNQIEQSFTRPRTPRTNGKAERVIRTIMTGWHHNVKFTSRIHRQTALIRYVNWYNTVKPHKSLKDQTPMEQLINYFYPQICKQRL